MTRACAGDTRVCMRHARGSRRCATASTTPARSFGPRRVNLEPSPQQAPLLAQELVSLRGCFLFACQVRALDMHAGTVFLHSQPCPCPAHALPMPCPCLHAWQAAYVTAVQPLADKGVLLVAAAGEEPRARGVLYSPLGYSATMSLADSGARVVGRDLGLVLQAARAPAARVRMRGRACWTR
jgi:hypothetical protein